jgi:hypothetical protein
MHKEERMTDKKQKLSRRNFLLTAGAGSVAAAAAVVATRPAGNTISEAEGDERATRGYQASEHVNNYYRTTKV